MQNLLVFIRIISFVLIFMVFRFAGFAQSIHLSADLLLADSVSKRQIHPSERRDYVFKDQKKSLKNSNPISLIYGGSLYVYQNFISQHFSADCLYDPSCSEFSKKVVKEYGLLKGILLTVDRLGRCNRIAATDLNPGRMNKTTHRFSDSINRYK